MTDAQPPASSSSNEDALFQILPSAARLALAYAPRAARIPTLALFALDARLAGLLRHSREPMLAQLRLSWWRETLRQDANQWPEGEPLLGALRSWNGEHKALTALVDGWEMLTGSAPLGSEAIEGMAQGRAEAFAALARALDREGERDAARVLGREWALADLSVRISNAQEREAARTLFAQSRAKRAPVSRSLRPLLVLHGLATYRLDRGEESGAIHPMALLKALRLGLLGR